MIAANPSLKPTTLAPAALPMILIVDDEPDNRLLLQRILRSRAQTIEAGSALEALAILDRTAVDLVLLDIMMPDMTGLEALQILRTSDKTVEVPVILISALAQNDSIVAGLQMGANDYIAKPFDIDVAHARINTQLKLKKMMDRDKQAIADLEAARQMKDRLLRIASHDLKAPLANVKMMEVLLRDYVTDLQAVDFLDMLSSTVKKMNGVIEEFLDMAACQSGQLEVHLGPVDVQQVVCDVAAHYRHTAQDKQIALAIDALPGVVNADEVRLTQVLNNLVSNAIKYSPPHTTISLGSNVYDDRVRIHITDQGPGILETERDKLFKEFSKLSNRPTGGESSTGLGLWIVKNMVTLQGGTVGVECPSEGGSIFWVEFPLCL